MHHSESYFLTEKGTTQLQSLLSSFGFLFLRTAQTA